MSSKTCPICRKSIKLKKECEEMGVAYHSTCFRCSVCDQPLSEFDVKIREDELFCSYHGHLMGGFQPLCKVYFNPDAMCYRIIKAEKT